MLLLSSCTIQKRHYRNGFYADWNRNEQQRAEIDQPHTLWKEVNAAEAQPDERAITPETPASDSVGEPHSAVSPDVFSGSSAAEENEPASSFTLPDAPSDSAFTREKEVVANETEGDEPKPESHDRINPKTAALMIGGVALSLLFVLIDVFAIAGSAPFFFVLAPFLGVLLFVGALLLRNSYVARTASGEKSEGLRLSAHFHRFRIMLLLFFSGALAMAIGWAFAVGGGFSLAAAGIIALLLGGSGMVIVQGVAIVLLILALIYLFRWRKDPTGYKPPRNPHPPKDR